jgi:hypothetical protein
MVIKATTKTFGGQTVYIKGMGYGGVLMYTDDKQFAMQFTPEEAAEFTKKHLYKADERYETIQ